MGCIVSTKKENLMFLLEIIQILKFVTKTRYTEHPKCLRKQNYFARTTKTFSEIMRDREILFS